MNFNIIVKIKSNPTDPDICRICLLECKEGPYCNCKGTIKNIHVKCLLEWMNFSRNSQCELCNSRYFTNINESLKRKQKKNYFKKCCLYIFKKLCYRE